MNRAESYHSHPGILGGTPVFTGTRVPVDSLVHHLRAGVTLDGIIDDFPSVRREQAEAFLLLALNDAHAHTPAQKEPGMTIWSKNITDYGSGSTPRATFWR